MSTKHKIILLGEERKPSDEAIVAWSAGKFFCNACRVQFDEQGLRDHLDSRLIPDPESEVIYQNAEIAKRRTVTEVELI